MVTGFILYNGEEVLWNPEYFTGLIKLVRGSAEFYVKVTVHKNYITDHQNLPLGAAP